MKTLVKIWTITNINAYLVGGTGGGGGKRLGAWMGMQSALMAYLARKRGHSWRETEGRDDNVKPPIYLSSEHKGKCLRIFCATETLAASINSSTIWFASRIWYIPAETTHVLAISKKKIKIGTNQENHKPIPYNVLTFPVRIHYIIYASEKISKESLGHWTRPLVNS